MPEIETIYADLPLTPGSWFPMGKDGTFWQILKIDEAAQTALVIAEDIIGDKPYHKKNEDVTWENCTLRAWLNGEYLEQTFSARERAAIVSTHLQNPDNPKYHTKGGNDTEDHIFLLSLKEEQRYFASDAESAAGSWWWLRSPGDCQRYAARVYYDGSVYYYGGYVSSGGGLRPAFNINLKSEFFQSLISSQMGVKILHVPMVVIQDGVLKNVAKSFRKHRQYSVPEGVTEIPSGAFRACALESVSLPASLKKIGEEAFADCWKKSSAQILPMS